LEFLFALAAYTFLRCKYLFRADLFWNVRSDIFDNRFKTCSPVISGKSLNKRTIYRTTYDFRRGLSADDGKRL